MAKHTQGARLSEAAALLLVPAQLRIVRIVLSGAMVAWLAACASHHPAPIVHRTPTMRSSVPAAAQPPAATAPAAQAVPPAPTAPRQTPIEEAPVTIETTPIPSSRIEARALPGPGSTIAAPLPAQPSIRLETEPKATRQPYSEALFDELKAAAGRGATEAAAPASAAPGPVAVAPPSVAVPAPTPPAAPPSATPAPPSATPAPPAGAGGGDFAWPAAGQVLQGFAEPRSMGITIAGKPGDPIVAAADGRVIFSGPGPRGYGNLVILKHSNETLSVYGHNRTLLVKEGQNVRRGQRIAELGSSGADSPQLRFEIRKDGRPVDPRKYLPQR